MITHELPTDQVMLEAFLARDTSYDGIFVTGVQTTGIFCRPTCSAKKPRPEHVRFFGTAHEALLSGFRPCKRCRPMEPSGTAPEWLRPLLAQIEADPGRQPTEEDLEGSEEWDAKEEGRLPWACRVTLVVEAPGEVDDQGREVEEPKEFTFILYVPFLSRHDPVPGAN